MYQYSRSKHVFSHCANGIREGRRLIGRWQCSVNKVVYRDLKSNFLISLYNNPCWALNIIDPAQNNSLQLR